jgi:hypothetical protein
MRAVNALVDGDVIPLTRYFGALYKGSSYVAARIENAQPTDPDNWQLAAAGVSHPNGFLILFVYFSASYGNV